jgi:hypothetical protein
MGIMYRWATARLRQRSQEEMDRIQAMDIAAGRHCWRRDGTGQIRTQAKTARWDDERPNMSRVAFNTRPKRARRWFEPRRAGVFSSRFHQPPAQITG